MDDEAGDRLDYEAGDEFDCAACGEGHPVQEGKGLRVAGSSERLDPAPYVRCPERGVLRLTDDGPEPMTEASAETDAGAAGDDNGRDDWP